MSQFKTVAQRHAALIPPDLYAEVTDQYQDAALEVTGPISEPENAQRSADKNGTAGFDGAPKPSPHDEFGQVAYHRETDARTDLNLMAAQGKLAAAEREEAAAPSYKTTPAPQAEPEAAPAQPLSFAAMKGEQAAAVTQEAARNEALIPPGIRAELEANERSGFQKAAENASERDRKLIPPAIVAEIEAQRPANQRRQGLSLGL